MYLEVDNIPSKITVNRSCNLYAVKINLVKLGAVTQDITLTINNTITATITKEQMNSLTTYAHGLFTFILDQPLNIELQRNETIELDFELSTVDEVYMVKNSSYLIKLIGMK